MKLALLLLAIPQNPTSLPWVAEGWQLEVVPQSVNAPTTQVHDELGRTLALFLFGEPWHSCFQPSDHWAMVKAPATPSHYSKRSAWTRSDKNFGFRGHLDDLIYLEPRGTENGMAFGSICTLPALDEYEIRGLAARPGVGRVEVVTFEKCDNGALQQLGATLLLEVEDPATFVPASLRPLADNAFLFDELVSGRRYKLTERSPAKARTHVTREARRIARLAAAGEFHEEQLLEGLAQASPLLRAAALRAFEPRLATASPETMDQILSHLSWEEPVFARQVACSFGLLAEKDRALEALIETLRKVPGDRSVLEAVRTGIYGRELDLLLRMAGETEWRGDSARTMGDFESIARDVLACGRRNQILALIDLGLTGKTPAPQARAIAKALRSAHLSSEEGTTEATLHAMRKMYALSSEVLQERFNRGEAIYEDSCTQCHLPSGIGANEEIPSLRTQAVRQRQDIYLAHERKPCSPALLKAGLHWVLKTSDACQSLHDRRLYPKQIEDMSLYLEQEWFPAYR